MTDYVTDYVTDYEKLGELNQCFLSLDAGDVVWTGFTQPPFDLPDIEAELHEFGLRGSGELSFRELSGIS